MLDSAISRHLATHTVHVDSSFRRRGETSACYDVFLDSYNNQPSREIKDVTGVRLTRAVLPVVHDNVIPGLNAFNLHLVSASAAAAAAPAETVRDAEELRACLDRKGVLVQVEPDAAGASKGRVVLSAPQNVLLLSADPVPDGDAGAATFGCLLVTRSARAWNVAFPLQLRLLGGVEHHRVLLKPGHYFTSDLIRQEVLDAISAMQPPMEPVDGNLFDTVDWTDTAPGWSTYRESKGNWNLYFRTPEDVHIFMTRDPGPHDVLLQLGAGREESANWFDPTENAGKRADRRVFEFQRSRLPSFSDAAGGGGGGGAQFMHELRFDSIDMMPRRYVDVVVDNLSAAQAVSTNSSRSHANVVARVDLCQVQRSYSAPVGNGGGAGLDERNTHDLFATYENAHGAFLKLGPRNLDRLSIKLVDNFGYQYLSGKEHTLEITLSLLGDPSEAVSYPVHRLESLPKKRRRRPGKMHAFPEYELSKRRARAAAAAAAVPDPAPAGSSAGSSAGLGGLGGTGLLRARPPAWMLWGAVPLLVAAMILSRKLKKIRSSVFFKKVGA